MSPKEGSFYSAMVGRISPAGGLQLFQLFRYGSLLAIGILLAKSGLGRLVIGQYETLMLLSGLTSFFWVGALFNALVPIYSAETESSRPTLIFQTFAASLLISLLIFGMLLVAEDTITAVLSPDSPMRWYRLFCWYILINNPAYLAEYVLLLRQKSTQLVAYGISVFGLQLIAILLVLSNGGGLYAVIWALILFAGLKLLVSLVLLSRYARPGIHGTLLKKQCRLAAPLAGSLLLGGASAYIDGLIISIKMDRSSFAIFQYGAREFPLVLLLANAFSTASSANVSNALSTGNLSTGLRHIQRGSARLMNLLFPISVLLMLSSKWLYPLVFSPEFEASYPIFNIYLLLIASRLLFPQTVLTGLQRSGIQLVSAGVEFILNLGLSLLLLPKYGMQGVAFATVIAHMTDKVLLMIWLSRTGISGAVKENATGHSASGKTTFSITPAFYTPLLRWLFYCFILAACFIWTVFG